MNDLLKKICVFFLITNPLIIQCQIADPINQYNNNGEKHGYWIEYVNEFLVIVDKEKAIYWRYVLFDDGARVYPWRSEDWQIKSKRLVAKVTGNQSIKDSIVVMDGIYQFFSKKGKLLSEDKYHKGKQIECKTYCAGFLCKDHNILIEHFDYSRKYNNQEGSAYIILRNPNGTVSWEGHYKKVNGRWK